MKMAIDVASGERPTHELVLGCINALVKNDDISLVLVGDQSQIEEALKQNRKKRYDRSLIDIIHTDEIIEMMESPAVAIKKKRQASVVIAAHMAGKGEVDAFFSPGNTGATLAASLTEIGRLKGVMRPPLLSMLPKKDGEYCMLDMGANVDCTPEYLAQFAVIGSVFAKRYSRINNPRVALLNIGEENSKGNALHKKAFEKLSKIHNIHFIGNIEPDDMIKTDRADVVITDGFNGNMVLKTMEGTASFITGIIKSEIQGSLKSKVGALLLKPVFSILKNKLSSDSYGSAVLIGIKSGAFVGHGKTSTLAMSSAIDTMYRFLQAKVNDHIVKELHNSGIKKGIF